MFCLRRASLVAVLAAVFLVPVVQAYLSIPAEVHALYSSTGRALLRTSSYNRDYWNISDFLTTQQNGAFCSVATLTTIFNALGLEGPSFVGPYHFFSQDNLLNNDTEKFAPAATVASRGMTMDQFTSVVNCFPALIADAHHANESSYEFFRDVCKRVFRETGNFVAINFNRPGLDEVGGGHWSPVAAYSEEADMFLVMDVARFKYPPVWVEGTKLWDSMLTVDTAQSLYRGFVVVSYRDPAAVTEDEPDSDEDSDSDSEVSDGRGVLRRRLGPNGTGWVPTVCFVAGVLFAVVVIVVASRIQRAKNSHQAVAAGSHLEYNKVDQPELDNVLVVPNPTTGVTRDYDTWSRQHPRSQT